jgi:ATP-dependent Clp protease ATP-binding subunit ClpC
MSDKNSQIPKKPKKPLNLIKGKIDSDLEDFKTVLKTPLNNLNKNVVKKVKKDFKNELENELEEETSEELTDVEEGYSEFVAEFDRFSRNALNIASNLSDSLGHPYIGSDHLMYGILSQDINNSLIQIQVKPSGESGFRALIENIKINADNNKTGRPIAKDLNNQGKGYSKELVKVLDTAFMAAMSYNYDVVTVEHLFLGILETNMAYAKIVLGITDSYAKEMVEFLVLHFEDYADKIERANKNKDSKGENKSKSDKSQNGSLFGVAPIIQKTSGSSKSVLETFGINLNDKLKKTKDFIVSGRDKELEEVIITLLRKQKNNPIIIGEPGVGKTALVELLALKINQGLVPDGLKDKLIYSVDTASIIAGSIFRGEFEQKIKVLMQEVMTRKNVILFIDELHTVIGAGAGMEKGLDMSNILKPYLARGEVSIIGATTNDEYRTVVKKDKAFERRFQPVTVEQPSIEQTKDIVMSSLESYQNFHAVSVSEKLVDKIIDLGSRYLPQRFFPDKAFDILDEACALRKLQPKKISSDLLDEDVNKVVSKMSSIPLEKLNESIFVKISNLESRLNNEIFGQKEAINSLVRSLKRSYSGVNYHNGPISSFLFLGPTGVGKTQLVKSLAQELFGDEKSLLKIDMSELSEKHSISRLTGTSAGYVGYDDAPQLTEFLLKRPNSIVLFDEIEKGHPQILNLLLQMLEDGYVTDGKGNKISCKDTVMILTSNIGVDEFNNTVSEIGFATNDNLEKELMDNFEKSKKRVLDSLSSKIKPEILGRLTDKIVFNPITEEILEKIIDHELSLLKSNFIKMGKLLIIESTVVSHLVTLVGKEIKFGARDVKKVIQKEVLDVLSEAVLDNPNQFELSIAMVKNNVEVIAKKKQVKKVEPKAITV